jgi:CBS-domain-containing membrane protein
MNTIRPRLPLQKELLLALPPTAMVLVVLGLLESLSRQRVLFASLASSAFLIYLDPRHNMNTVRVLATAHLIAALVGLAAYSLWGGSYLSASCAMTATILILVLFNVVHPPAVGTSLTFAFRAGEEENLALFLLALSVIAMLVLLEQLALWLLRRLTAAEDRAASHHTST